MKIAMIVVFFLLTGSLLIISNNNLYMSDENDRDVFVRSLSSWTLNLNLNMQNMNGFLFKQDWLPDENVTRERPRRVGRR